MTSTMVRPLLMAAVLMAGGVALADLPRLPADLKLTRGADSPGQVIFRHDSHVESGKPGCIGCHPQRFSILGRSGGGERRPQITHAAMEKGQACGACHGKAAFGFDDCTMCHAK
jgi:c(7)-type cytochrome triheme protein